MESKAEETGFPVVGDVFNGREGLRQDFAFLNDADIAGE